jgi:hypothetical protein|tara:strand:+ start:419 stop:901 length:483 start_codon:yes stop_codon:yes gene_type:complete
MPINVPQSVFDKYFDVIDSTFNIFGVTCQLVSIEKREVIVNNPNNNIPDRNTINNRKRGGGEYDIGTKTIREIETLTDIKLKVYWDNKKFIGITDQLKIPDGSIQTIGFMSDLPTVLRAKQLIVHKEIKDTKELRFERFGEHIPIGLKQNRYFACFWKRV